jgi:hypothetical protein
LGSGCERNSQKRHCWLRSAEQNRTNCRPDPFPVVSARSLSGCLRNDFLDFAIQIEAEIQIIPFYGNVGRKSHPFGVETMTKKLPFINLGRLIRPLPILLITVIGGLYLAGVSSASRVLLNASSETRPLHARHAHPIDNVFNLRLDQSNSNSNAAAPAATPAATPAANANATSSPAAPPPTSSAAAQAKTCKEVPLGPNELDLEALAATIGKSGSEVTVTPLGKKTLLLCGTPSGLDVIKRAVQHLSGVVPESQSFETHYVRLFFFRRAGDLATTINNSSGLSVPVKALGDDLLLFTAESTSDNEAIHKLKQWIAMIDVPRPEISLLAWSAQISAGDKNAVRDQANRIRSTVTTHNERLQRAIEKGRAYLEAASNEPGFFAPQLKQYLTQRYFSVAPNEQNVTAPDSVCGKDQYCLGFTQLFVPVQPSLSRLLLTLIASDAPDLPNNFIDSLEGRSPGIVGDRQYAEASGTAEQEGSCESNDYAWTSSSRDKLPGFKCLREQLGVSLSRGGNLAQMRVALADFLYQYKIAQFYPNDFVAWNQSASAAALDTRLNPIIVAFNRDLAAYLHYLQDQIVDNLPANKKVSFASDGIITARVVSGNPVRVDTTTQNFFESPPTLSVRELFKAASGDNALSLSPFIAGHAAELLAAGMQAEQRTTAKVGRDLNLQITANTLQGASAAEMDVTLNSGEGEAPTLLTQGSATTSTDNLNRVAKHNVTTKVRVDSQKLFEISSFESVLVHGKSVPLLPPFVDLPYLGNLARLRLPPGTTYHKSFAIVSAVIIPTAADLANVIEFRADLERTQLERVTLVEKPTAAKQDGPQKQILYYWIVAHYRNGDSVSRPIRVVDAPKAIDKTHTVELKWSKPRGAQSFDVLRTTVADPSEFLKKSVVAEKIKDATIVDAITDKDLKSYFLPDPTWLPRVTLLGEPKVSNAAPPATRTLYYWIVTHYREGDSISGPFRVAGVPQTLDEDHAVTLVWRASEKARSFDVLRTFSGSRDSLPTAVVVNEGLAQSTVVDTSEDGLGRPKSTPSETQSFRRIHSLMDNLSSYHRKELDCIAKEADVTRGQCTEGPSLRGTGSVGP